MPWPASERYALTPAPAPLTLAHDLLNTRGIGARPDLLGDEEAANGWVGAVLPAELRLTEADAERLRAFREQLQAVVADQASVLGSSAEWAGAAELRLGPDGVVELASGGGGSAYLVSVVLAGIYEGQLRDEWRRLKACKNEACQAVFYDRSRNNSGVWHSLKTCGNPANLRAHRARNKEPNG